MFFYFVLLQKLLENELGNRIFGKQDPQDPSIFYTDSYVESNKAKIRGALGGVTRPMPISAIIGQSGVTEALFFCKYLKHINSTRIKNNKIIVMLRFSAIIHSLQSTDEIPGTISGKQGANSIYTPSIYSKNQNQWIESFYRQNGFLGA